MRVHFIAIGGSAMHNLALALHDAGHDVTGSDDEIYEPSRSRLEKAGLLPAKMGWDPKRMTPDIDAVILGMHARIDNPELVEAQKKGLKIFSYPEFVAKQSKNKKRIVVAGSHGKTTTTSIILNALSAVGRDYDYLVGAQLKGFDRMVRLSDAGLIILEGDEYLSSPIDRRPKMMHYDPDIAIITGIAWDHINVFPTFADYVGQFEAFVLSMRPETTLYYYERDEHLRKMVSSGKVKCRCVPYGEEMVDSHFQIVYNDIHYPVNLIGRHNMQNIRAARHVAMDLGISPERFFESLINFEGAAKRLQTLWTGDIEKGNVFLDFAHAPSKVRATVSAVKDWYDQAKLIAILELHTYSSLNKDFIPQYKGTLDKADEAVVFFSEHTLKMKNRPPLDKDFVREAFDHPNIKVMTDKKELEDYFFALDLDSANVLLMSSGIFEGAEKQRIWAKAK